jgi:predicted amidohydrolase
MKTRIACLQMDVFTGDVAKNLATADRLFSQLKDKNVDFIILPEMWATGFAYDNLKTIATDNYQELKNYLSEKAKSFNATIIGGTLPEPENGKIYNSSIIFGSNGKELGKYRKQKLFQLNEEHLNFAPGNNYFTFDASGIKCAVLVCYDLRFSEFFLKLHQLGVQLAFIPAQFPHPRQDHWITLLKARAIENQYFVVGCNRVGGRNIEHFGHSSIIDPHGVVVAQAGTGEEVIIGEIDLDEIVKTRSFMPMRENHGQS